jgi:hypothetical protein
MDLEELKSSWEALSKKMEKQNTLNAKLIEQMTKRNYLDRVNKIAWPEFIGTMICFIGVIPLLGNFRKLNTPLLQVFGGLSILYMVVLPILSLRSIKALQTVNTSLTNYSNTLKEFARRKIRFQRIQKLARGLNFPFMIVFTPVAVMLFSGKDITQRSSFWLIMLPVCLLFQFFISRWVLKHYNNALLQAEAQLTEMDA